MHLRTSIAAAVTLALVAAGCATTPPHYPELDQAHEAVASAQASADVNKYAPLDLQQANALLEQADAAARERQLENIRHYAYLATRKSQVAFAHASAKVAETRIAAGDAERQRVQLEARNREAVRAKSEAERAKSEAERAKTEAERANMQALVATDALRQAQAELADLNAKQTERGVVVTLGDVLFDTGQAVLKPGATRSIDSLTRYLRAHPERRLLVEGFTDSVGGDEYNRALSQRRAEAVKSALVFRGISTDRIEAIGLGKEYAVASNDNSGGRQLNRRVEVTLSDEQGRVASR